MRLRWEVAAAAFDRRRSCARARSAHDGAKSQRQRRTTECKRGRRRPTTPAPAASGVRVDDPNTHSATSPTERVCGTLELKHCSPKGHKKQRQPTNAPPVGLPSTARQMRRVESRDADQTSSATRHSASTTSLRQSETARHGKRTFTCGRVIWRDSAPIAPTTPTTTRRKCCTRRRC